MDYSVYRRSQAEAAAVAEPFGSLTWVAGRRTGNAEGVTVGRVVIKRGHANPRHAHNNCEEVLYLLAGRLEHTVGRETVTLEAGDTLVVAPGVFHNAKSIGGADADMMVAYSSGERGFHREK